MKLRSSKAACYVGAAIVLFMTPVLPAVATTYEKTQNTDTGIKVASYSANTEEVLVTGYEETGTYKNKAVAITDPYLDVYDTSDEETAQVVGRYILTHLWMLIWSERNGLKLVQETAKVMYRHSAYVLEKKQRL